MSRLSEFVGYEEGWEQIYRRFRLAIAQKTEQAALAPDGEHAEQRGQLHGWKAAFALLDQIRQENKA